MKRKEFIEAIDNIEFIEKIDRNILAQPIERNAFMFAKAKK